MLTKRIIPCLDVKDGRTVKGVNFVNLRDAGDAVELTPEQYKQVAAYVIEGNISAADLAEAGEVVVADAEEKADAPTSKRRGAAAKE